ncbi:RNA polymerase sigma factor [Limibacter armeniacum]|uniref:RNA polymerase sigma factor n=1 Tax=Limibacter armeniacum TaxID=466084 RepID=UPI002FE514B6
MVCQMTMMPNFTTIVNSETLEDTEILRKFSLSSTKEEAFRALLEKYQERVYWHIRKLVITHEDADDLTQETFIKAWHNLNGFEGKSQLYTWLYRIATNHSLNFLNKKKKRFFLSIHDVNKELANKLDESELISGDEIQIKLQKAILKLPEKQRLVFNMKYFEDMSYQDISEVLDTSVGALKASYHHAVKKIEHILTNS